jgi:hypothetical protein
VCFGKNRSRSRDYNFGISRMYSWTIYSIFGGRIVYGIISVSHKPVLRILDCQGDRYFCNNWHIGVFFYVFDNQQNNTTRHRIWHNPTATHNTKKINIPK